MTRDDDEMKNAAYAELTEQGYLPTSKTDRMAVVDIVVDVVEPLIRADERAWPVALADGWTAEAARYRGYAEGSSNPAMHRSVAQTLEQCADAVRAAGAGIPEGSRLEAGTETSVQPDAIGPDTRSWADLRAKVEALGMYSTFGPDGSLDGSDVVLRSDVLDLLDGGDHHGNA